MFCPSCQLVVAEAPEACPACGGALRDVGAADTVELVEATASIAGTDTDSGASTHAGTAGSNTRAVARLPRPGAVPALARLAELPALAWRQPAVRSAVRTGAGALALSLVVHAARTAISSRRARGRVTEGVVPAVLRALHPQTPGRSAEERDQAAVDFETFIYVRQTVRR
jgi:hypothetical protein